RLLAQQDGADLVVAGLERALGRIGLALLLLGVSDAEQPPGHRDGGQGLSPVVAHTSSHGSSPRCKNRMRLSHDCAGPSPSRTGPRYTAGPPGAAAPGANRYRPRSGPRTEAIRPGGRGGGSALAALVLADLWLADRLQQLGDDVLAGLALG